MTAISIDVLPAARGDCLWIECARPIGPPWRLLIDGGMPESWPLLRDRINRLSATGPVVFDLAVVSHIDSDHNGGMLPLFAATDLDVSFKDVWFNGLQQWPENNDLRSRSVTEGEQLVELLSGQQGTRKLPWNAWFGGAAVMTRGDGAFETIAFPGGPTLSLLSPTPRRLASLRKTWTTDLLRLQRGESDGPPEAPVPMPRRPRDASRSRHAARPVGRQREQHRLPARARGPAMSARRRRVLVGPWFRAHLPRQFA